MGMRLIWIGCYPATLWTPEGSWSDVYNRPLIRGYDDAGNLLYNFSLGSPNWPNLNVVIYPTVIKGDIHRNLYIAFFMDDRVIGIIDEIRKFDCYGNELVTAIHHYGAPIKQIEIDSNGNIFIVGVAVKADGTVYSYLTSGAHARVPADNYYTLHKFNSSETLIWSIDSGEDYYTGYILSEKITIDGNGDVIVSYDYGDNIYGVPYVKRLKKLSGTDGSTVWGPISYTADNAYNTWTLSTGQLTCDSSNNIYCLGFEYTTDYFLCIFKYNSSGVYQSKLLLSDSPGYWYENPPYFKMDGSDVLHVTTKAGYYKFNTSLVQTFFSASYDPWDQIPNGCPAIDGDGGVYYGHPGPTGWYSSTQTYYQLKKYTNTTPTMTFSWGAEAYYPLPKPYGEWDSFACINIVENCEHASIPIRLDFGSPTLIGDTYVSVPALSIPLTLAMPGLLREYVGHSLPVVYRCYLTGGPGTIELPLANFQCRRMTTGISLSVVCPALTAAQITEIQARTAGELIIKRGPLLDSGIELLDEMIRATFSTLRFDAGTKSGSITISGQSAAPTVNSKTRTLTGISYRNLTNGARRVRCAVDTYLAVGDIANLGGGETITIAEIIYNISPDAALMEIVEDIE